jgi:hypothetical protein
MGIFAKQLNLMNSLFHPPCKNRVKWHLLEFIIKDKKTHQPKRDDRKKEFR